MLYNTLHNRWLRILMGVVGCFISALSLNVFIVPQGLYTGGLLGFCQVIRTLLYTHFGIGGGSYDLAGVLYAIFNIPLFLLAYKALGRDLLLKTVICTVAYSFFYSVIPIPSEPVVEDMLTSCLLGGIFTGIGSGLILTCGCSGGGERSPARHARQDCAGARARAAKARAPALRRRARGGQGRAGDPLGRPDARHDAAR